MTDFEVTVNGGAWTSPDGTTVAGTVRAWCPTDRGIAVARNGVVVPKSEWDSTLLHPGDTVEIVTAAAGG
ncbi:MAG: sulfur carrier protein ThiS [Acidimicrobiales bacterium]